MEKEIVSAEIFLHPVNTEEATADIDRQLKAVEEQLKSYTLSLSGFEQAAAVAAGLIAGAVDLFLMKETSFFGNTGESFGEQVRKAFGIFMDRYNPDPSKDRPIFHPSVQPGIAVGGDFLEKLANKNSIAGMIASVVSQLGKGGVVTFDRQGLQLFPDDLKEKLTNGDLSVLAVAGVIVGVLKWLSADTEENKDSSGELKTIDRIRELIRSAPAFSNIVKLMERWQGQLPNELISNRNEKEPEPSAEKVFVSFLSMLAVTPGLKDSNLSRVMHVFRESKRTGLDKVPVIRALTRQAFPVLVNEVLVRTLYFAVRLAKELSAAGRNEDINWENVLPFGNRNIDRLLMISSLTMSAADTADAALRALLDSRGEMMLFAARFMTRVNLVADGRAVMTVVREYSNERVEMELLREKRLLTESKTGKAGEILQEYQRQLDERLSGYIAEDLVAFMKGFDLMDQGLAARDSDLVIRGNVIIQRVLGREPQFTSQQEFNDLMDSDMPLKL